MAAGKGGVRQLQRVQTLWFGGKVRRAEAQPRQLLVFVLRNVELEAAPAFVAKAHEVAARLEQGRQLAGRQLGAGRVNLHFEVEPVHPSFGAFKLDTGDDRVFS